MGLEDLENRDSMETKPLLLKLPIEIFLKIIEYVLDSTASYAHSTYYSALLSLRRVSKRWAEVMDDASKLWTRVPLDSPEELVEMALRKSRGRPLDISGRRGTSSIAARVEAEAHRWRTLELDSSGSFGTFTNLLSRPAPLLEILDVASSSSLDPTIPIFNYAVPNIRVIKIRGCQLPWGSPHISNLQELSLQQLEGRVPSITEILDILHRSPHLTHLHISFSMISLSPFSSALRVKLPRLQSLVLEYLDPKVLNRLVHSIEAPHDTSCTFNVPLVHGGPLEEQLAHISERLGSLGLIPQTEPPILSLKAHDGKNRGMLDLFGIEAKLRYFARGRSNAYLVVGVGAPLERHIDILNLFASRLRFSSQSWSPELRLTNVFQAPHIDKTINLLATLSQALPSVRTITFIDTTNRVDRTTDILQQLFPPDSGTTRLFPHLAELTIQARLHDPWANSFATMGTDQDESGRIGHFPLDTLRFRGGAIRRESIELLQGVVPSLLFDNVKTVKHSNAPKLELYLFPLNDVEELIGPEALENRDSMGTKPLLLQLPIEIFLKIIEYVLDSTASYAHNTYYSALLSLRRVSKRWAEVMDDASTLWTKVPLDSPEELVEMALKKSRGRPLDIAGRRGTSSITARVEAEAHRWRTLELDSPGSFGTFISLLSRPAPLLEILDVASSSSLDPMIPMFNYAVPNIRVIKIRGCQLPWGSPNISNLRELNLTECRVPSITVILDILRRSPHLTHLHISFSVISLSPFSSALRVKLPRLQSFDLGYLDPEVLNRLVRSIEVPHDTNCTFHVQLDHDGPLEEQLAHMSERLGSLGLIPQTEPPILSLKAKDGNVRGLQDLFGHMDAELRYFARGRSNAYLVVSVGAPPERHIDILNVFASRLRFSSQSWSPELRLTNMFQAPHIDKTINLLATLSQALPNVRTITFIDTTNRVDRTTDILQQLFPPDSGTTRLFPHLTELTIQAQLHDSWANSFAAIGTDQDESGGISHFPLDTLRFRGGSIRRGFIELLQGVVPSLMLDNVKVQ